VWSLKTAVQVRWCVVWSPKNSGAGEVVCSVVTENSGAGEVVCSVVTKNTGYKFWREVTIVFFSFVRI